MSSCYHSHGSAHITSLWIWFHVSGDMYYDSMLLSICHFKFIIPYSMLTQIWKWLQVHILLLDMDLDMTPCLHICHFINCILSLTSWHRSGYGSIAPCLHVIIAHMDLDMLHVTYYCHWIYWPHVAYYHMDLDMAPCPHIIAHYDFKYGYDSMSAYVFVITHIDLDMATCPHITAQS